MRYLIIPMMGLLLLCSCGNNTNTNKADNQDITVVNDEIIVNEKSAILEKIKVETVVLTPYQARFTTSGVVKAIPTSYAEIATPFAGRIVKSFVRLGQKVTPGSPIFEISSPTFFEAGKAYFGAKQEMEQARKALSREKDLFANHVGVAKDVEEAEVTWELKKQDYENALSALKVFQVDPSTMKLGEALIVRSPIAGKIVTNNIVIGQYIKEDAEPMAIVADLNKVWVVAHVKEKDISMIEKLKEAEISLSASPEKSFKGTVYHISDMLDQDTRSAEVIIECDNRDGRMKPFMYGTVLLTDETTNAIMVSNSAILQQEDNCYVLMACGSGKFRKVAVTAVSTADGDKSVITSGLKVGDQYVSSGAFYLLDAK